MLLKPLLPVVDYMINYDYFVNVLCENKAKPELKCNGKCQLMKNLAKVAEEEKPISTDKKFKSLETEVLFFQELQPIILPQVYFPNKNNLSNHYSNLYFHKESGSVFHPPKFQA